MSGLPARPDESINGLDVREQGNTLRVATNTPHLVSLGTGRLSTAVTLHPIKQGRVTIGSDPTCDIYVVGSGVASVHCRVENSHGVVTLYPVAGSTLVDSTPVDKPTRLSQGSMLTIGRSNYLRFNHPAEAMMMKAVLPSARRDQNNTGYVNVTHDNQCYQHKFQDLSQVDQELDITLKELSRTKPPVAPKDEKLTSIMSKVSKFEYYAKQQKNVGRSQFYTNDTEISPKVFSSNSLTVNTPAKDVLGGRSIPNYMKGNKVVIDSVDKHSYANVDIRNNTKISDIVRNYDEKLPKKVNNDVMNDNGKIYNDVERDFRNEFKLNKTTDRQEDSRSYKDTSFEISRSFTETKNNTAKQEFMNQPSYSNNIDYDLSRSYQGNSLEYSRNQYSHTKPDETQVLDKKKDSKDSKFETDLDGSRSGAESSRSNQEPSRSNVNGVPQYSPVYANQYERAESMRIKAYQERVKEEVKKEAEMERLEEILDIFTEYQKQLSTDYRGAVPVTPTEKRPHNKIITNGSLPRSVVFNNPNFVKTSEGYKFETNQTRRELSPTIPRNMSNYENFEPPNTPEVTLPEDSYENIGRMDEIGIPVFEDPESSQNEPKPEQNTDIGSPYENLYVNRPAFNSLKPKSPNTSSPRTGIKTTFAHKNLPSPQYFIFPTPSIDKKQETKDNEKIGIEKQLSLEEDIPMIDDSNVTNDIEFRYAIKNDTAENIQSFDDVKKELMADIPELEAFENDLKNQKREKAIKNITENMKIDVNLDNSVFDVNIDDLKGKYDNLKEERRKLVTEIHEVKCKMSEITSQEDDILRELEMEKALIKGEYDSEIAILKIEQKKKTELVEKAKKLEEEIKDLRERQETRQNEMRDRVEIATMKVERLEKDVKTNSAILEELQNAQDILDNESKIYEDLEFQHLEEESELLSNREDLQNEITLLTKKIDAQKTRILTLKSEANNNLTSALDETKVLHNEYVKHLNNVEELTAKVQELERELKPIVSKLNEIERAQSPDSAFYTDQTRTKSGEFGYSPQNSDSDDLDTKISNYEEHTKEIKDKFNSIDQMSQSMTVDIERKVSESPKGKEKKGFWERNFDSLKRKKKLKSPEKVDIMSQSLNENLFYNNEIIENDSAFDRFGSLRHSKKKDKNLGPIKSNSSSKIPTFAALGKIIKKDSFGKKNDEEKCKYIKNSKPSDNKYKSKSLSPDKVTEQILEEEEIPKIYHRKSCGDEPTKDVKITDSSKVPSQDDIDRISKVTFDAPLLSNDTDVNTLGKRTLDSLKEIERKRIEMLEEQGCQMIENEREKISELKRRAQDETKKLWDQKYREKSVDSDFNSLTDDRRYSVQSNDSKDRLSGAESNDIDRQESERMSHDRSVSFDRQETELISHDRTSHERSVSFDRHDTERMGHDRSVSFDRQEPERMSHDRTSHDRSVSFDRSGNKEISAKYLFERQKSQEKVTDSSYQNFDRSVNNKDRSVNFGRSMTEHERQEMVDFDRSMEFDRSGQFDRSITAFDQNVEDSSHIEDGYANSTIYEESSGLMSSSIEELQVRNSRTESTEDEKRSDDSRPLSHASDFSRDNILSLSSAPRRSRRAVGESRPLTRYLPVDRDDFDLRRHVESAGHQILVCPYVTVTSSSCRGYLHKLGAKFHTWSKRWFVFDRVTKTFVYYWDKSEKKPRGGAYFQVIEEVYLDHGNTSKSPSPQTTFIVKTRQRRYYLMAPSGEAARIWIDAIFTGAQGYTEYLE